MKSTPPLTVHLEVLRAFWLAGSAQPVGALIEVSASLATDLVNAHKARLAPAPVPAGSPEVHSPAPETPPKPPTAARRKERST